MSTSMIPWWLIASLGKKERFIKADFERLGSKEDQQEFLRNEFPHKETEINRLTSKEKAKKFAEQNGVFAPKEKLTFFKARRADYKNSVCKDLAHGNIKEIPEEILERADFLFPNRNGNECIYCGCYCHKKDNEEIFPCGKGGLLNTLNRVTACNECNSSKGDKIDEEFEVWVKQRSGLREPEKLIHYTKKFEPYMKKENKLKTSIVKYLIELVVELVDKFVEFVKFSDCNELVKSRNNFIDKMIEILNNMKE